MAKRRGGKKNNKRNNNKNSRKARQAQAQRNQSIRDKRAQNSRSASRKSSKKSAKLMMDVLGITNNKETYGSQANRRGLSRNRKSFSDVPVSRGRPGEYGKDNYKSMSVADAIRYGSNSKRWDKVAKKVGVGKKRNDKAIARMVQYVTSGGNVRGNDGNGRSGGGGGDGRYDRNSGEFKDIKGALGEDRDLGYQTAKDLANKNVSSGSDKVLNELEKILGGGLTGGGGGGGDQTVTVGGWPSELDDLLAQQQEQYEQQIADMNEANANTIAGLQDNLNTAQNNFSAANSFMEQQLAAANAAALAAQQRAENMRNAFVPQANPTALSVAYGDQRQNTTRKPVNNQLSDLAILSGVGTTTNPLAGLQLA